MNYRQDIDGLRGIAVASVILYHIDSALLPGGFIGVDIFFVISGYLISTQIFGDIDAGRFSLTEFYRRRIKRIAPAMLLVVGVTLLVTQFLFVPDDAEVAAEAAFFSLFSVVFHRALPDPADRNRSRKLLILRRDRSCSLVVLHRSQRDPVGRSTGAVEIQEKFRHTSTLTAGTRSAFAWCLEPVQ
jgi:hypothetical protein